MMICPKCKKPLIFIAGGGWDYDVEFCSDRNCGYEHEYSRSSLPGSPRLTLLGHIMPSKKFIHKGKNMTAIKHVDGWTQAVFDEIKTGGCLFRSNIEVEVVE